MRDTLEDVARWLSEGKRVAQATVVSLVGSAPRGVGATLVVSDADDIAGSVSNGCVEPDVVEQARRVMRDGRPRLLTYGVSEEQNYERIGLSCGGEIRVFLERVEPGPELERLESAEHDGRPAVRAIVISTAEGGSAPSLGASLALTGDGEPAGSLTGTEFGAGVVARARELLGADHSVAERISAPGAAADVEASTQVEVFYQTLTPPRSLVIVGAGHISLPLTRLAKALGYRVTVVDPREAFNTETRLPEADARVLDWPDEALERLPIHPGVAVVVLTHDEKFDVPALEVALRRDAGYVGMVGSRGTRASRDVELREAGVSDEKIARIHGPIGLDIGARTPDEIALAILAQIVASSHGKA